MGQKLLVETLRDALENSLPYLEDLIALEKAGVPSGFKRGVVDRDLRNVKKAIAEANKYLLANS